MEEEILYVLQEIRGLLWMIGFLLVLLLIVPLATSFKQNSVFNKMLETMQPQVWRSDAQDLFSSGKFDELIKHCDNHLSNFPEDSLALWWKARAYMRLQRLEEAIALFEKVKILEPNWDESSIEPYLKQLKTVSDSPDK